MVMTFAEDCWNGGTLLGTWATARLKSCSATPHVQRCPDIAVRLLLSGRWPCTSVTWKPPHCTQKVAGITARLQRHWNRNGSWIQIQDLDIKLEQDRYHRRYRLVLCLHLSSPSWNTHDIKHHISSCLLSCYDHSHAIVSSTTSNCWMRWILWIKSGHCGFHGKWCISTSCMATGNLNIEDIDDLSNIAI